MIRTRLTTSLAAAALALVAAALPTQAAVFLSFEAGAATPATGGAVAVPIYLHETLTDGSTSAVAPDGLYSVGVAVARTGGAGTIVAFDRNPTFDQLNASSLSATGASVNAQQNANFGAGPSPDLNGRILFATATILPGAGASDFSIGDWGAGDQTVNYRFESLDAQIVGGTFTVSALPEPTTLAALAGTGGFVLRRRRRA